jgi:SRSO17 transposase
MVERVSQAKLPVAWVVADSVYGGNLDLRTFLEARHYAYVLEVACDEPVGVRTSSGLRQVTVAQAKARYLHMDQWHRVSMSTGTKGPRLFDWALLPRLASVGGRWTPFLTGTSVPGRSE